MSGSPEPLPGLVVKRCTTCGRFRRYEPADAWCMSCGHDSLADACGCGRRFDYALDEPGESLHCPRCGTRLRGRSDDYE